MKIRPKIEAALTITAERLSPGSGDKAVRDAKNDLSLIDATGDDFNGRYADEPVAFASPAVFEAKHFDGDPVTFRKHHDGVIIIFSDSFLFIRGMGLGAREIKAVRKDEVTVECVATIVDGVAVPGLRIIAHAGKPAFALAITRTNITSDPTVAAAVRDEIYQLLTT